MHVSLLMNKSSINAQNATADSDITNLVYHSNET